VVLAANETPLSKLEDPKYFEKIFQLDTHVATAIAGLSSDARVLISQSRVFCQSNRLLYDEPVDIEILTRRMGDQAQVYTHVGRKSEEANKLLEEKFRPDLTLDEAISLAVETVKIASEGEITSKNCKVAVIPKETRAFRRLEEDEVEKHLK